MARNPGKDQIAIVGVGSTPYGRDLERTTLSLGAEAAIKAIEDAGVDRQEIDGICAMGMDPLAVGGAGFLSLQGALGIRRTTWVKNSWLSSCFVYAAEAVFAGHCDMALIVQAYVREPSMSRSAAKDPFRLRASQAGPRYSGAGDDPARRWMHSGESYAGVMGRYMHDYGASKEVFGRIAVNNRSHASRNPNAVMRIPITLDDYLASPMVWAPMQMFDMDVPVDCGEALIVTTAERARDLRQKPVYVHAASFGGSRIGEFYENIRSWTDNSLCTSMEGCLERSDLKAKDMDLFYAYDGYTVQAVCLTEAAGYCGWGEATDFLRSSWDDEDQILRLNGRTLVNTHGGGLSQGRAGGFNFFAEAVRQLRGNQGERQAPGARSALIGAGSFFHDPVAAVLHVG